jgi:hypothetical protein
MLVSRSPPPKLRRRTRNAELHLLNLHVSPQGQLYLRDRRQNHLLPGTSNVQSSTKVAASLLDSRELAQRCCLLEATLCTTKTHSAENAIVQLSSPPHKINLKTRSMRIRAYSRWKPAPARDDDAEDDNEDDNKDDDEDDDKDDDQHDDSGDQIANRPVKITIKVSLLLISATCYHKPRLMR